MALPENNLYEVHYFTARVKERYAGDLAPARQHAYLRVLLDQGIQVHFGKFRKDNEWTRVTAERAELLLEPPLPWHLGFTELAFERAKTRALPDKPKTEVQRFEEKGSDVNLASFLLRDAYVGSVANQLVVTGDSDLLTPIKFAVDHGVQVHSLVPNPKQRVDALSLAASSLRFVEMDLLEQCQLPDLYSTRKGGAIRKPEGWS